MRKSTLFLKTKTNFIDLQEYIYGCKKEKYNEKFYSRNKPMKNNQLIIYKTEDGKVKIETHFENETLWLTQAQIGELFQKSKATISEHIKNIFKDGELEEELVVRNFRTTNRYYKVKRRQKIQQ